MNVVLIIQARMGSTRLPGKVLMDLAGEPMLARVVHRASRAKKVDEVIVATTITSQDAPIADLCKSRGWECFRGAEKDVLDRYYQAAKVHRADVVVRVTADCPLIDFNLIDLVMHRFLTESPPADYASNVLPPRTFPRGLDVEVLSMDALDRAWRNDGNNDWREHVTPFIHRHPEDFSSILITNPTDYSMHRWTVDTPEDFQLVARIYNHFRHDDFTWQDVIALIEENPEWVELNQEVRQKGII